MKTIIKIILVFIMVNSYVFAADIFAYPSNAKTVLTLIPDMKNISCKFTQIKTVPNSPAVLKSGGDFVFDRNKGVIFYTKYPVQMTTAYNKNEQINHIISDVINKKYSSLEKNFQLYFKKSTIWELGLIPKNPQLKQYIKTIYISGDSYIQSIEIKTTDGVVTKINFKVM